MDEPATIPIRSESSQGTSTSYAVRRLGLAEWAKKNGHPAPPKR